MERYSDGWVDRFCVGINLITNKQRTSPQRTPDGRPIGMLSRWGFVVCDLYGGDFGSKKNEQTMSRAEAALNKYNRWLKEWQDVNGKSK